MSLFSSFLHQVLAAMPLFMLIALGWLLVRWRNWPETITIALNRVVFRLALPAMLFRLMCDFSAGPAVDVRLLLAFFGGCLLVFIFGRLIASRVFKLDGVAGSVFALGGIFSNNVLLGIPVAKVMIGDQAMSSVALVLVFNGLLLWTLATASVEWYRHGSLSVKGIGKTTVSVLRNPLIISILSGTAFSFSGLTLPTIIDRPLTMIGQIAVPLALIALGMSLAVYRIRDGLAISYTLSAIKLVVMPLVVWALAALLGLPPLESKVVVLLASMSVGVNVYLMSQQFQSLTGPAAASMLITTVFSAITTPVLILTMDGVYG